MKYRNVVLILCMGSVMPLGAHDEYPLEEVRGNPLKEVFRGKPWQFMEYSLVIRPAVRRRAWTPWLKTWIATLASGVAGATAARHGLDSVKSQKNPTKAQKRLTRVATSPILSRLSVLLSALIPSFVAHARIQRSGELAIDKELLYDFVAHWEENQDFIPEDLHQACTDLYELLTLPNGEQELQTVTEEMVRLIRRRIYEEFPNRYDHYLRDEDNTPGNVQFIVQLDLAKVIVGIFDLLKSVLIPSSSK